MILVPVFFPAPVMTSIDPLQACGVQASDGFLSYQQPMFMDLPQNCPSVTQCKPDASEVITCPSRSQVPAIACDFDAVSGAYTIIWHADSKKLQSNDHSLVSPAFELS